MVHSTVLVTVMVMVIIVVSKEGITDTAVMVEASAAATAVDTVDILAEDTADTQEADTEDIQEADTVDIREADSVGVPPLVRLKQQQDRRPGD
jgi:hypothetical protein